MSYQSNWSFVNWITNELCKIPLDEQKAPTLWPSSATAIVDNKVMGKCRRQAYYRYATDLYNFSPKYSHLEELISTIKEAKLPPSLYTQWIWKQGELYEQHCIDLARDSGIYVGTQVSVYIPAFNVSGKIDLIVLNPETSTYHIVEVKSVYGFNANSVIGTDASHRMGKLGEPRDAHLMQLGIYQWWYGNPKSWGPGILLYGSRDTGRAAEYLVTVEEVDSLDYIFYQGQYPVKTDKVNSGITIQSIMNNYKMIMDAADSNELPPKDFELIYSQEKIEAMYEAGQLNKTDTAQYERRKKQLEEGKSKLTKEVIKGDWQCRLCDYKKVCYPDAPETDDGEASE